jgi:hypothetical protein
MLLEENMVSRQDLDLFAFAESAEEAWQTLVQRGLPVHSDNR